MQKIITITQVLGALATNCYTVANVDTRDAIVIDPSGEADKIMNTLKNEKLNLSAILLTHGHFDHIYGLPELKKEYPDIKVYIGREEADIIESPRLNLSEMFGASIALAADKFVDDNDELELIGTHIRCIHVPGHTKGGMCYYLEAEKLLFSGDTLFHYSMGRSDFPTGDERALIDNIRNKLFALPDDVIVYPGHNDRTTIKNEKIGNPFLA